MNFIGFPPHTWLAGTTLPGGTTLFGNIIAFDSILAPSRITVFAPINAESSIVQLYNVQPEPTITPASIFKSAFKPEGREEAVCNTQLSPITIFIEKLILKWNILHIINVSSDDSAIANRYTMMEINITSNCSIRCDECLTVFAFVIIERNKNSSLGNFLRVFSRGLDTLCCGTQIPKDWFIYEVFQHILSSIIINSNIYFRSILFSSINERNN